MPWIQENGPLAFIFVSIVFENIHTFLFISMLMVKYSLTRCP